MEAALVVLVAAIPIVWQAWQYFDQKRLELKDRRFNTYHDLIRRLVESDTPQQSLRLDRQIAVVYELRNFPEYKEVTLRILDGLRKDWSELESTPRRLLDEIDLALAYLRGSKKSHTR